MDMVKKGKALVHQVVNRQKYSSLYTDIQKMLEELNDIQDSDPRYWDKFSTLRLEIVKLFSLEDIKITNPDLWNSFVNVCKVGFQKLSVMERHSSGSSKYNKYIAEIEQKLEDIETLSNSCDYKIVNYVLPKKCMRNKSYYKKTNGLVAVLHSILQQNYRLQIELCNQNISWQLNIQKALLRTFNIGVVIKGKFVDIIQGFDSIFHTDITAFIEETEHIMSEGTQALLLRQQEECVKFNNLFDQQPFSIIGNKNDMQLLHHLWQKLQQTIQGFEVNEINKDGISTS